MTTRRGDDAATGRGDAARRQTRRDLAAGRLVQCRECLRIFNLADETDAEEWYYGHDCEAPGPTEDERTEQEIADKEYAVEHGEYHGRMR